MKWEFSKISYLPSWLRVDNTVSISLNCRIILILQKLLICAKYLRSVECDNLVVNTTILIHLVLHDRFGSVCTAFGNGSLDLHESPLQCINQFWWEKSTICSSLCIPIWSISAQAWMTISWGDKSGRCSPTYSFCKSLG